MDHASVVPGSLIAARYKVVREAGTGNFSKVFVCIDTKTGNSVAVKLLKRGYDKDADFERDVLAAITKRDVDDKYRIAKMLSFFKWNGHPCFVFQLKGASLRTRPFGVTRGNFTREEVASLTRDVAHALNFMHFDVRVIHTDLKPENILVDIPSSDNQRSSIGEVHWSLCDLGSASFMGNVPDSDLISTRPYRAPEVILGSSWSYAVDVWSMACIIFEVYTGFKLFEASNDEGHLAIMEQRLGRLPESLLRAGNPRQVRQLFSADGRLLCRDAARSVKSLPEILCQPGDAEFLDLMQCMLRYEPAKRLRAGDILQHPFLKRPTPKEPIVPISISTEIISASAQQTVDVSPVSSRDASFGYSSAASSPLTPQTRYNHVPLLSPAGPQTFPYCQAPVPYRDVRPVSFPTKDELGPKRRSWGTMNSIRV